MNKIVNRRPGILVLPQSKLVLKPNETLDVEKLTDELRQALSLGWIKTVESNPAAAKATAHEWNIDYSRAADGVVTVTDKATGRQIEGEIAERKGERYFMLKEIGTVKGQQYWPTAQALERFNGGE